MRITRHPVPLAAAAALTLNLASGARAQVNFTGSYFQDFDTLSSSARATWVDNGTIIGWYAWHTLPGSGAAVTTYSVGDGSAASGLAPSGGVYSLGSTGSAERALGGIAARNMGNLLYGVQLLNTTGAAIDSITVTYDGEQWRNGGNGIDETITFGYQNAGASGASAISGGSFTAVSALDFTSPVFGTPAAALNGNDAANRATLTATLTGLNWQAGEYLWLRWTDTFDTGNNNALGIDNVRITLAESSAAAPEPGSLALAAAAALGAAPLLRRRRSGA